MGKIAAWYRTGVMRSVMAGLFLCALSMSGDGFPSAQISNGAITAKFYLPDPEKGYYRGTRFDWSGVIYSLRTANHEYFGQWFPKYDPKLHDAIMGPVEEFRTNNAGLGFDEAKAGETFIRIGVGVVRKPDDQPYQSFKTYDIVDHGKWKVRTKKDRVEFVQELKDKTGYGYRYTKVVRLEKDQPVMVIEHILENTGSKRIQSLQYNHNFFVMDGQPTGPESVARFPFDLKPVRPFEGGAAAAEGKQVRYLKELDGKDRVFGEFEGFGKTSADYDIHMENRKAGAGVHITGDQPLARLVYWSIRTVFSPEPYIHIEAEPGRKFAWKYTYRFYDLAK